MKRSRVPLRAMAVAVVATAFVGLAGVGPAAASTSTTVPPSSGGSSKGGGGGSHCVKIFGKKICI